MNLIRPVAFFTVLPSMSAAQPSIPVTALASGVRLEQLTGVNFKPASPADGP